MSDNEYNDTDDVLSNSSYVSSAGSLYMVTALQHKVDRLELQLELKSKDITILERDVQLRDKEIEILQMKLRANNTSQWI
jgi:hypothetical protein